MVSSICMRILDCRYSSTVRVNAMISWHALKLFLNTLHDYDDDDDDESLEMTLMRR